MTEPHKELKQSMKSLFDLEEEDEQPTVVQTEPIEAELIDPESENDEAVVKDTFDEDFETVRKSLLAIIEIGQAAAKELSEVAKKTNAGTHYEALSSLIKAGVEANRELLKLYAEQRTHKGRTAPQKVTNTTNVLIATTEQALAALRKKKQEAQQQEAQKVEEAKQKQIEHGKSEEKSV